MVVLNGQMFPNFKPRYYQTEAAQSVFDYFNNNTGSPVIAMPTGSGKSWVIAMVIYVAMMMWPNQRFIVCTHDSELIKQDLEKLLTIWPLAPVGVFSASLKRNDIGYPIIFGTVKSIANEIQRSIEEKGINPFGYINALIIDEAQFVGEREGAQYSYVISEFLKINPDMSCIGLSATPFRMKLGLITENGVFTDFCYDITKADDFVKLVRMGFLSAIYTPAQIPKLINENGIGLIGGEYNQAQATARIDCDDVSLPAVKTTVGYGVDRRAWLMFASSVAHSENLAGMLNSLGVPSAAVHSKNAQSRNDEILKDYKRGLLRCVVNNNKLTVGFDYPEIDLISCLRLTNSPALHGQMMGRGARTADGKNDCLFLDFTDNLGRLGPINDLQIPEPPSKRKGTTGPQIVKICPNCNNRNSSRARECLVCGQELPYTETSVDYSSMSNEAAIKGLVPDIPIYEDVYVERVIYNKHSSVKRNVSYKQPSTMCVTYFCNGRSIKEYICFEHSGYARQKAEQWWYDRTNAPLPLDTNSALRYISTLRKPNMLKIRVDKEFPEIVGVKW